MDEPAWQGPALVVGMGALAAALGYGGAAAASAWRDRWPDIVVTEGGWRVTWRAGRPYRDEELFGRRMRRLHVYLRGPRDFPILIGIERTFLRPVDEIKRGELERAARRLVHQLDKMGTGPGEMTHLLVPDEITHLLVFEDWLRQVRDMPRIWKPGTVYGKPRG